MRRLVLHGATVAILVGSVPNIVWASSAGRRNTAIAATAIAAGAWTNGTGKAGRRNTALLATGGAVYAWSRYHNKKRQENRRRVCVMEHGHPVYKEVACVPADHCCRPKHVPHGKAWGYWKKHGHHDDDDD